MDGRAPKTSGLDLPVPTAPAPPGLASSATRRGPGPAASAHRLTSPLLALSACRDSSSDSSCDREAGGAQPGCALAAAGRAPGPGESPAPWRAVPSVLKDKSRLVADVPPSCYDAPGAAIEYAAASKLVEAEDVAANSLMVVCGYCCCCSCRLPMPAECSLYASSCCCCCKLFAGSLRWGQDDCY